MQTLFLRSLILAFVALGIAAAHSWNTSVILELKSEPFDWTFQDDKAKAAPVETEGKAAPEPAEVTPSTTVETPTAETPGVSAKESPEEPQKLEQPQVPVVTQAEPERTPSTTDGPEITLDQAKQLFDRQFLPNGRQIIFIDARTRSEFLEGHIENAMSLPAGEFGAMIPAKARSWLPGSAIVIYCKGAECHDSHDVARRLQGANLDITPIFIFKAGYPAWVEAEYPTMTGPDLGWEL